MKTIFEAVFQGDLDEIRKIRAEGNTDINALNNGESALTIAINSGNLAAVKELLEFKELDLNQETYTARYQNDLYPTNALFSSVKLNRPDMVRELLAKGADPTRQLGFFKATPLMAAAAKGSLECLKLLLVTGKGIHLKDAHGNTALDQAAKRGYSTIVGALIPFVPATEMLNAAGIAEKHKHPEIAQLLRNGAVGTVEKDNPSTSSLPLPKVSKQIGKSTTQDNSYHTLLTKVKTLEERLKLQEEVVTALQEELKVIKESRLAPAVAEPTAGIVQPAPAAAIAVPLPSIQEILPGVYASQNQRSPTFFPRTTLRDLANLANRMPQPDMLNQEQREFNLPSTGGPSL